MQILSIKLLKSVQITFSVWMQIGKHFYIGIFDMSTKLNSQIKVEKMIKSKTINAENLFQENTFNIVKVINSLINYIRAWKIISWNSYSNTLDVRIFGHRLTATFARTWRNLMRNILDVVLYVTYFGRSCRSISAIFSHCGTLNI